jgi:hypothetical protein
MFGAMSDRKKTLGVAALLTAAALPRGLAQTVSRPAPSQADWLAVSKLPDFSGVWEIPLGPTRGLTGPQAKLSLTPEYAARKKAREASGVEDDQTANCLPAGMPVIMSWPYPMEFVLAPGKVTILLESFSQIRHIYTDGRPLPTDPDPKFNGTSVGRWEGDTLVAETIGFSTLTELERNVAHSDKMRIIERFRLTNPDTMTIETTLTDPEALTTPFTTTRVLKRHRTWTLAEYVCEENNRNFMDAAGKAGVKLDPRK